MIKRKANIKFFLLPLFLFLFQGYSYSQGLNINNKIKAEYVMSFGQFVQGFNYTHNDTFLIAYYGKNNNLFTSLKKSAKLRKIVGRKVLVVYLKRLKDINKLITLSFRFFLPFLVIFYFDGFKCHL